MAERGRLWRKRWPDHRELTAEASLEVPFQDADPTGMAWHGNYFRYYDAARIELLAKVGMTYRDMAAADQVWPVVETQVRYLAPLPFGAEVRVRAQLVEWMYRLRIYYTLYDDGGRLVNEAVTVQVPVAARSQQLIVGSPSALIERIVRLLDA